MARRFFTNLVVNLSAGFVLFFFSERLFWTVFKPGDSVFDLCITWLAYSVLATVFLNIVTRFRACTLPRIALAGAIYGWLAEGALVGTLYGTEASAPFPQSIVQTAISWHMLLSVVTGFSLLTGAVRRGDVGATALMAAIPGIFWGLWAPFQWRESPPIVMTWQPFAMHAFVASALLAFACVMLAGPTMNRYKPGWFGLALSLIVLGIFYSAQVKALGGRPLIILPVLVGGTLALLGWTKPLGDLQPASVVPFSRRWPCAAAILIMPLTATLVYALQLSIRVRGLNPAIIFNGLAVVGLIAFIVCAVHVVRSKRGIRSAPTLS